MQTPRCGGVQTRRIGRRFDHRVVKSLLERRHTPPDTIAREQDQQDHGDRNPRFTRGAQPDHADHPQREQHQARLKQPSQMHQVDQVHGVLSVGNLPCLLQETFSVRILSVSLRSDLLPARSTRKVLLPMRKNNFDIVRLALAAIVVFVHCYDLSGAPALAFIFRMTNARIAVEGFFAISGFLIFASYERCASLGEYFRNRAWRILPAYWLSTLFCLAIAFSWGSFHVGKFLLANLTFANFLSPGIPGVFAENPGNNAMNGALWTIKIELMFYVAVPLIVWLCRRLQRDAVLWGLFVLSVAFRVLFASHDKISIQLPGQLSYFMIGALIYYHLAWFKRHGAWLMLASALVFGLHTWTGWFFLRPAAVAALTLGACQLLPHVEGPARWGDFSYGTYILHYPIVQSIVAAGLFRTNGWLGLCTVVVFVACAASLSWFLVEKPSLAHSRSRRLRQAALHQTANYPAAVP